VATGDTLGTVGMTGRTTGPHLHFEVRIAASAINPELVLR
jgi:murein DD-endopeptidase MepM/ murein hydrolase activator NlpD